MKTKGYIKEEVYDRLGFLKDMNYDDKEVDKQDNITQEMCHQAKITSNYL